MAARFVDDSMIEMGQPAPHGRYVQVYLNGQFWGQYHLRTLGANMGSSYFGGDKTTTMPSRPTIPEWNFKPEPPTMATTFLD